MRNDELQHVGKKGMKWKHRRPRQREKYIDPRYSGGNVYRRGEGGSQSRGFKDRTEKWASDTAKKQAERNHRELNRQNIRTAFSSHKKKKKLISRLFGGFSKKKK